MQGSRKTVSTHESTRTEETKDTLGDASLSFLCFTLRQPPRYQQTRNKLKKTATPVTGSASHFQGARTCPWQHPLAHTRVAPACEPLWRSSALENRASGRGFQVKQHPCLEGKPPRQILGKNLHHNCTRACICTDVGKHPRKVSLSLPLSLSLSVRPCVSACKTIF